MSRQIRNLALVDVVENGEHLNNHVSVVHGDNDKHLVVMTTRKNDTELRIWLDPIDGAALVIGRPVVGPEFTITLDPNTPSHVLIALMTHA